MVVGTYTVLAPFGYAAFALWCLLPTKTPERRARMLQAIMRRAFTFMHDSLRRLGLLEFDPRKVIVPPLGGRACVLVANHPSLCDVTSIMSVMPNVTTAITPRRFRARSLKPLLQGALFFEGMEDYFTPGPVIDAAVDRLSRGFHVVLFPEGTRSPEGKLGPFGRTAFEIACRADAPVVPIVIEVSPPWLSKEHGIFSPPWPRPTMRLTVLPPVFPADCGHASRALSAVVCAAIRRGLKLAPGSAVDVPHDGASHDGNEHRVLA